MGKFELKAVLEELMAIRGYLSQVLEIYKQPNPIWHMPPKTYNAIQEALNELTIAQVELEKCLKGVK